MKTWKKIARVQVPGIQGSCILLQANCENDLALQLEDSGEIIEDGSENWEDAGLLSRYKAHKNKASASISLWCAGKKFFSGKINIPFQSGTPCSRGN